MDRRQRRGSPRFHIFRPRHDNACAGDRIPHMNSGFTSRVPGCGKSSALRDRQGYDVALVARMIRLVSGPGVEDYPKSRGGVHNTFIGVPIGRK